MVPSPRKTVICGQLWTFTPAAENCNLWTTVDILPSPLKTVDIVDILKLSTVVHRLQFFSATPIACCK